MLHCHDQSEWESGAAFILSFLIIRGKQATLEEVYSSRNRLDLLVSGNLN